MANVRSIGNVMPLARDHNLNSNPQRQPYQAKAQTIPLTEILQSIKQIQENENKTTTISIYLHYSLEHQIQVGIRSESYLPTFRLRSIHLP